MCEACDVAERIRNGELSCNEALAEGGELLIRVVDDNGDDPLPSVDKCVAVVSGFTPEEIGKCILFINSEKLHIRNVEEAIDIVRRARHGSKA